LDLGGGQTKITTGAPINSLFGIPGESTKKDVSFFGVSDFDSGSNIGIKGVEDIGGGLKVGFTYEFGIQPDVAPAIGKTNAAHIDLTGGFGGLRIGTQPNGFDKIRAMQPSSSFFNSPLAMFDGGDEDLKPLLQATGKGVKRIAGTSQNALTYSSPTFNGFSVSATVASSNTKLNNTTTTKSHLNMVGASYESGPVTAHLAIGEERETQQTRSKIKNFALGFQYDAGFIIPIVTYEKGKKTNTGITVSNFTQYELGVAFKVREGTYPWIMHTRAKDKEDALFHKFSSTMVGFAQYLSKRTYVYGAFASEKIKTKSSDVALKGNGFGFGIVHKF
jgi:predicted porin